MSVDFIKNKGPSTNSSFLKQLEAVDNSNLTPNHYHSYQATVSHPPKQEDLGQIRKGKPFLIDNYTATTNVYNAS